MEKLRLAELQGLCQKQGIDGSGTRTVIIERLRAFSLDESAALSVKGEVQATTESMDDEYTVILLTSTDIDNEPNMIRTGREALEEAIKDDLYVKYDPTTVENQRALAFGSLPREMAIVKNKLATTETRLASTESRLVEVTTLERRLRSLEEQVESLTISTEGYREIRNRFINVYARSTAPDLSAHARKEIWEGNQAAHGGDAKADADLYRPGATKTRIDIEIFDELYGFLPSLVWTFSKQSLSHVTGHRYAKQQEYILYWRSDTYRCFAIYFFNPCFRVLMAWDKHIKLIHYVLMLT